MRRAKPPTPSNRSLPRYSPASGRAKPHARTFGEPLLLLKQDGGSPTSMLPVLDPTWEVIYGLGDPRTRRIHYVGRTTDLTRRWKQHIYAAKAGRRSRKDDWIRELLALGLEPWPVTIEKVRRCWGSSDRERYWIEKLRQEDEDLNTNVTAPVGRPKLKIVRPSERHRELEILALKVRIAQDRLDLAKVEARLASNLRVLREFELASR